AEKLDAVAEGLRRGSADLAAGWRGAAAAESHQQLRQFYASARSLAVAARSSALALDHAAQSLALARFRASMLPGGDFPSTDPHSMQSWGYQQVLADLNAAYRDAAVMAPNQIAACLPDAMPERESDVVYPVWEDLHGSGSTGDPGAGIGGGGWGSPPRP